MSYLTYLSSLSPILIQLSVVLYCWIFCLFFVIFSLIFSVSLFTVPMYSIVLPNHSPSCRFQPLGRFDSSHPHLQPLPAASLLQCPFMNVRHLSLLYLTGGPCLAHVKGYVPPLPPGIALLNRHRSMGAQPVVPPLLANNMRLRRLLSNVWTSSSLGSTTLGSI